MSEGIMLVLANGEWTDVERAVRLAERARYVIAADGAWAKASKAGIRVDLVVGDLDSLSETELEALQTSGVSQRCYPPEKDATDLELAIDHALTLSPAAIWVFGALGQRLDHGLANLGLLERGREESVPIRLVNGRETAWMCDAHEHLGLAAVGDRVSILPVSECAVVSTVGLQYPLHEETLYRAATRGVSNVVASLPCAIDIHDGRALLVHAPRESDPA